MLKQKNRTQKKKRSRATRKRDHAHPYWYFDAAVAFAGFGETDTAFLYLQRALRQGFRECKWLKTDESFKPLRKDKRWPAILKKCKANMDAFLEAVNLELYRMYKRAEEDQVAKDIDRKDVERRNKLRLKRVRKMLHAGKIKKADDFYHAASIVYHGPDSSDYELAHELALKAVELDHEHGSAMVLAASAKDVYLLSIGKPQVFGTQLDMVRGKIVLKKPFDLTAITAREREKWCGSFLSKIIKSALKNTKHRRRKSPKSSSQGSRRA